MANKTLPVFQALISSKKESELLVDCVAIVDNPAIERVFMAFSKDSKPEERLNFSKVDSSKRIVVGPAMIPDLLIYRNNEVLGEHQVFFSKDTVESIAEKFYAGGHHTNSNEMHNPKLKIEGMNFFMSFIRNEEKGLVGLAGDYPDGTWFLGAKITDDAVWEKVQSGEYKGFSVEGLFQYKEHQDEDELLLAEIEKLATEDTEDAYNKIIELLSGTNPS